jgi:hypothetical protein
VVFNTFFALVDQSSQLDCFRSVANHLMPGGRFLLECFVPDLARFDRNQRMGTSRVGDRQVVLEASRHHPASQRVESQHVILGSEGNELIPVSIRYVWPAEMDLMAHIAGFELEKRSGGWAGEPFDDMSNTHVSVYRLR